MFIYVTTFRRSDKEIVWRIFDLVRQTAEGTKTVALNVFYQNDLFKTRSIVLEAGGKIPACRMESYVMFYVVEGEVLLHKNEETSPLREEQVFISEPALISMESQPGQG